MYYVFGNRNSEYSLTVGRRIGNALCKALMDDDPWMALSKIKSDADFDVKDAFPLLDFILSNGGKEAFDWDMVD